MLLELKGIRKRFGSTAALDGVSFGVESGRFHSLIGENGAGKSTLIKILTGVYHLDEGEILWNGKSIKMSDPSTAGKAGINVIHQDRQLIPSFTGLENAYLGLDYPQIYGRIDWNAMRTRVRALMDELGIDVPMDISAARMTPPQRTLVEIVRAMMTRCRMLILDEPTATLTDKEARHLFTLLRRLRERGTAILYVSHRMEEVLELSTEITVLRNGALIKTVKNEGLAKDDLITLMSGEGVVSGNSTKTIDSGSRVRGEVLLSVSALASADRIVRDVSFDLRRGQILGVFGLAGSGRTEMVECVYGLRKQGAGEIRVRGTLMERPTPKRAIAEKMVLICEDRRGASLVMGMSLRENITLATLDKVSRLSVIDRNAETAAVRAQISEFSIKATGPDQPIGQLSGGNQQKVVFAKACLSAPEIFLCDEPTQAVDVKTRYEIHRMLRSEADKGAGVLYISSDLAELLEIADEILIIKDGRGIALLPNRELDSETVLKHCFAEAGS